MPSDQSADDSGRETVAYQFEVNTLAGDWHTTIQTAHPSETFGKIDGLEYRHIRELVYRDRPIDTDTV